jgi:hypothetical protein
MDPVYDQKTGVWTDPVTGAVVSSPNLAEGYRDPVTGAVVNNPYRDPITGAVNTSGNPTVTYRDPVTGAITNPPASYRDPVTGAIVDPTNSPATFAVYRDGKLVGVGMTKEKAEDFVRETSIAYQIPLVMINANQTTPINPTGFSIVPGGEVMPGNKGKN